jgi:hypothetical protein
MRVITLTTDFGLDDWFAGTMKGAILRLNPRATVVDITHGVPAGDVRAGAFALAAGCRFFPRGTIHVAVVDPGVGSRRAGIAVRTRDYVFVGPDNGVLSLALAREEVREVRRLENERFFLRPVSRTFHGRDIFAPVAAHVSRGVPLARLGPAPSGFARLGWPAPVVARGRIRGEVTYVDRFGNAITNIEGTRVASWGRGKVRLRGRVVCPLADFYQAAPAGKPVAVIGSSGFVEIALNGGNAAQRLGLKAGTVVEARRA